MANIFDDLVPSPTQAPRPNIFEDIPAEPEQENIFADIATPIGIEDIAKQKTSFDPLMLFKGLASGVSNIPADTISGFRAFTPDVIDPMLRKVGSVMKSWGSEEIDKQVEIASGGVLFPSSREKIGESINTWAAAIGRNLPIMMQSQLGRYIGGALGATIAAAPTPGPEEVATIPPGVLIGAHLGGYIPMVGLEAENFLNEAEALGIDYDIAQKWARPYGLGSGVIEYSQQLLMLKPFQRIGKPALKTLSNAVRKNLLTKVLSEFGVGMMEGAEELSQAGLMTRLQKAAIGDMQKRDPVWKPNYDPTYQGAGREFVVGAGVAMATRGFGGGVNKVVGKVITPIETPETEAAKRDFQQAKEQEERAAEEAIPEVVPPEEIVPEVPPAKPEVTGEPEKGNIPIAEVETIEVRKDNPTAKDFREDVPLGTTMGAKAAHAKYYTTLFRASIKAITDKAKNVIDVFGRSATLARVINAMGLKDLTYQVNDIEANIIATHNYNKTNATAVIRGYKAAQKELLSLVSDATGLNEGAFRNVAHFKRAVLTQPNKAELMRKAKDAAVAYFREALADTATIDTPEQAGKFIFLQRNSVRGVGRNQHISDGKGMLRSTGLNLAEKPDIAHAIREQAKFFHKENVDITQQDAFDVIVRAGENDFLLIDPPYFKETGYKEAWTPEQTFALIDALDEAHKRGAEFTYHDTYNKQLVDRWEEKGYKVYEVKVPQIGVKEKSEIFVISSLTEPVYEGTYFEKQMGKLKVGKLWGLLPAKKVTPLAEELRGKKVRAVQQIQRQLYRAAHELFETQGKKVRQAIKQLGGIRDAWGYDIHKDLIRKDSLFALDTIVAEINTMVGLNLENADALGEYLQGMKRQREMKLEDFLPEAQDVFDKETTRDAALTSAIRKYFTKQQQTARAKTVRSIKHRLRSSRAKKLRWGYQDIRDHLIEGLILRKTTAAEKQALTDFGKAIEEKLVEEADIAVSPEFLKNIGRRSLYDMTDQELEELDTAIQSVIWNGIYENRFISEERQKTIDEYGQMIGKQVTRGKPIDPPPINLGFEQRQNWWQESKKKAHNLARELTRMERFLEHLSKDGRLKVAYRRIFLAMNNAYNDYVVARDDHALPKLRDILTYGRTTAKSLKREFTRVDINARLKGENGLTPNEYKMIYIDALTEKGRQRLLQGNHFTEQDLKDIEKVLTPLDWRDVKHVMAMMEGYYDRINSIHFKIYGVDMPRLPNYFHHFVTEIEAGMAEAETMSQILTQPTYVQQALDKSMIKERKGGTAPLKLDFWGNSSRSIDMFEKYIAMGLVERDVRKLLRHPDIKNGISQTYGKEWYADLQGWFGDVIGKPMPQDRTELGDRIRALRLNAPVALLYLNATVPPRQIGSLWLGISTVGGKNAIIPLKEYLTSPMEIDSIIFQKDPIQRHRREAGERDIREMYQRYAQKHPELAIAGRRGLFEFGIKPVVFLDRRTSNAVWWMAYKTYLNKHASDRITPEQLEKDAIEKAQYTVRNTQPAWTKKDLPKLFRSRNEITKAVTMFQNFPNQVYNYLCQDTFKAYQNKQISKTELMAHLWWAVVVGSMFYGFSRRWRRPTAKETILDILLYPFNIIPLGRDISSTIEATVLRKPVFGGLSLPPFLFFEAARRAAMAAVSGKPGKAAWKAGEAFAYGAGIPFTQIRRTWRGIEDMAAGETRDPRRLFISDYALGRPKKKKGKPWSTIPKTSKKKGAWSTWERR